MIWSDYSLLTKIEDKVWTFVRTFNIFVYTVKLCTNHLQLFFCIICHNVVQPCTTYEYIVLSAIYVLSTRMKIRGRTNAGQMRGQRRPNLGPKDAKGRQIWIVRSFKHECEEQIFVVYFWKTTLLYQSIALILGNTASYMHICIWLHERAVECTLEQSSYYFWYFIQQLRVLGLAKGIRLWSLISLYNYTYSL